MKFLSISFLLFCMQISIRLSSSTLSDVDSYGDVLNVTTHETIKTRLHVIAAKLRSQYSASLQKRTLTQHGLNDFISQFYKNYTDGLPVFIKVITGISRNQFGNYFGVLLHDYACAQVSGAHFLLIYLDSYGSDAKPFEYYVPDVIVHQNAATLRKAIEIATKTCKAYPFPWEGGGKPLLDPVAIGTVRRIVHYAVSSFVLEKLRTFPPQLSYEAASHHHADNHQLSNIHHSISHNNNSTSRHPHISDVAIHYRCSDNIQFGNMGLLPFPYIISLIPHRARHIFIHTEPSAWSGHNCSTLIQALHDDLKQAFPHSQVAVRRIDMFDTMYDMIHSRMALICSSSTFCLHAVIGKIHGSVYFPRTLYGGRCNFNYTEWNLMDTMPRWTWPNSYLENDMYLLIRALRNMTLFLERIDKFRRNRMK